MSHDIITIESYDSAWPSLFRQVAEPMRDVLGDVALRIDHIGSTSIPNLAAKPIIDIQISVESLAPVAPFRLPLASLGYIWRADNDDLTKRYFREAPATRRTHIHVRRHGSWAEQFALLFRDYLREYADEADRYADVKRHLAEKYREDRHGYTEAKTPIIWDIMQKADKWAQEMGWEPGEKDA